MMSDPRCIGMCSACATTLPRGSKTAVEQSWRSLMFVEYDDRMSTWPISSAADSSAAPITSSVMRSMKPSRVNQNIGVRVDRGALPGEDHGRRVHLLHDRRPLEPVAGEQPFPPVDRV